jgi:hypothetical protein
MPYLLSERDGYMPEGAMKTIAAIAKTNGLSMAAGLVEQALGVTPKGNESLTSPGFIQSKPGWPAYSR